MHASLVLMLCSAVVHVGVSQSVIPQTVPPQSVCQTNDRFPFLQSLPNGIQCILGLGAITNPFSTPAQVAEGLVNYCTDDCGGIFSKYLELPCNAPLAAELVRLTCTATNGSATAGNVCHYASPTANGSPQVLAEISSCDNVTSDSSCTTGCRQMLTNLKAEIGCCFQNVYNNTQYDLREIRDFTQFLTQNQLDSLEKLTNPDSNPWKICEIEPPQMCSGPLFKAPPSPQCTTDDIINFLPSLPNPAVCGPSLANVLTLSAANDSTELASALDIVCNTDCGEAYSQFLKSTCNDQFQAETLRVWCVRTNGNANAGPYCRFAFDASFFNELSTCQGSSSSSCSPSCRSALTRFANDIGCCYQDLFNNTFYYQQQVLNEVITTGEYTTFTEINNPTSSPWAVCNVPVPSRCPNIQPPPEGKCITTCELYGSMQNYLSIFAHSSNLKVNVKISRNIIIWYNHNINNST